MLFLKNLVFVLLVPGAVAGWLPVVIAGGFGRIGALGAAQGVGVTALAVGLGTLLVAVVQFGTRGRGTPMPFDPPPRLVVRGPHRFVRNPMYLGALVANLGWALLFASRAVLVYAVAVWLFHFTFVVIVEEPSLRRRFGPAYGRYCAAVRRWLPGKPYEDATI
jgi:protein-S-isoprenylcysteine O-methyltransferase Ste14